MVPDSLISLAEARKDCLIFLSPELNDVVYNLGNEVTDILALRNSFTSSSFAVMDSGWKYQYDKYNDVYRWVPLNGDTAGLCARTDLERDPWFSPAGFNRGQIKNVVRLAWNPTKSERDSLYKAGVNPVVTFPGAQFYLEIKHYFQDQVLLIELMSVGCLLFLKKQLQELRVHLCLNLMMNLQDHNL